MFSYSPGDQIALVVDHFAVLLPGDTKTSIIHTIWERCYSTTHRGLLGILQAVTSAVDPTLENLPDFVLVERREHGRLSDVRIAVSGDAIARVKQTNDDAIHEVSGRHIAMWLEQGYSSVEFLEIGEHRGSQSYPIVSGVVRCSGLIWEAEVPTGTSPQSSPLAVISPPSAPLHTIDEDLGRTLIEIPDEWLSDHDVDESRADYAMDQSLSLDDVNEQRDDAEYPPAHQQAVEPVGAATSAGTGGGGYASAPAPFAASAAPPPMVGAGVVRFSHGEVVELGSPIVIGRRPSHDGAGAPVTARLISVPSPSKDISRNHVMIRIEAGHVLAEDLDSVNGTVLRRRGEPERTLPAREPVLILNDDVVDLGDGVSLEFIGVR